MSGTAHHWDGLTRGNGYNKEEAMPKIISNPKRHEETIRRVKKKRTAPMPKISPGKKGVKKA